MREIEFRGKRIDDGKWFYGNLLKDKGEYYYIVNDYGEFRSVTEVIPETVGQFVRYYENAPRLPKGEKLYEDDIVRIYGGECCQGYWEFDRVIILKDFDILFELGESEYVQKLGNIHDNPELMKKVK